jgi:predicted DCC family thiol-disulfide oxidoreductase YuxK
VTLRTRLRETFLELDPRSVGLFRLVLGCVLLGDLVRRATDIDTWYTNVGLVPNHTMLWAPLEKWQFSLFFQASSGLEARVGFLLCGLSYLLFLLGWRTGLAKLLTLVALVSLHTRTMFAEDGGDIVLRLVTVWAMFLPLGRRFSVDAVLASLARKPEKKPEHLAARDPRDEFPVVSLGVLAILLQLAVIYYFNAIHKTGQTWWQGTVVHYVLHQERMVQWLGVHLREHLPLWLGKVMTWVPLALEWSAPLLILSPWGRPWTRRAALILLPPMHVAFAILLSLGWFTPNMLAFFPLLLARRDWDAIFRWLRRRRRAIEVYYDVDCGVCFAVARVIARLDVLDRITLLPNDGELPPGISRDLVERTIVVLERESGRTTTRHYAMADILRALPLGSLPAALMVAPGLSALAGRFYDWFAKHRARISTFLGLPACGVPWATPPVEAPVNRPVVEWGSRTWARVREAACALLVVMLITQVCKENRAVPKFLRVPQPEVFHAVLSYLRLFEGWNMFAPDAPFDDGYVVVDAVTSDGRHVDPLNLVASRHHLLPVERLPGPLGMSQMWDNYVSRIERAGSYHRALHEWLMRHHERTGNPADKIVSFQAFYVEHIAPKPGAREPTDFKKRRFLAHP